MFVQLLFHLRRRWLWRRRWRWLWRRRWRWLWWKRWQFAEAFVLISVPYGGKTDILMLVQKLDRKELF
jgi:hypothetical protein